MSFRAIPLIILFVPICVDHFVFSFVSYSFIKFLTFFPTLSSVVYFHFSLLLISVIVLSFLSLFLIYLILPYSALRLYSFSALAYSGSFAFVRMFYFLATFSPYSFRLLTFPVTSSAASGSDVMAFRVRLLTFYLLTPLSIISQKGTRHDVWRFNSLQN